MIIIYWQYHGELEDKVPVFIELTDNGAGWVHILLDKRECSHTWTFDSEIACGEKTT